MKFDKYTYSELVFYSANFDQYVVLVGSKSIILYDGSLHIWPMVFDHGSFTAFVTWKEFIKDYIFVGEL